MTRLDGRSDLGDAPTNAIVLDEDRTRRTVSSCLQKGAADDDMVANAVVARFFHPIFVVYCRPSVV